MLAWLREKYIHEIVHIKVGFWSVPRSGAINKITKAIKIKKINNTSCLCLALPLLFYLDA
jgi:hypothetical protein